MLQIKNLNITHKKDLRNIISGFNFVLNPGDKAVIIGEEGNGKSTVLKWIYDPKLIEAYAEAEGECINSGEKIAYLPQELCGEDAEKSVYEYFCEEPLFWEQGPGELGTLAGKLHLPTDSFYSEQKMKTLSGGERIKFQMARILMSEPSVLLLDEPSNDIDIPTLEWLEELINGQKQAVLFVSHDETLVENTADVIIHMEQIRRKTISRHTIVHMPYRDYIQQREMAMRRQKQEAMNDRRQEKIRQEKWNRIQQKVEQGLNKVSRQEPHAGRLLKKKMKAVKSLEKRYERESEDMTQLPESEEAIFIKFGEDIRLPSQKIILDFKADSITVPEAGEKGETVHIPEAGEGTGTVHVPEAGEGTGTVHIPEAGEGTETVHVPETDEERRNARALEKNEENGTEQRILAENISLLVKGSEKVCIIGKNGAGKSTLLRRIAAELLDRKDIRATYMPQNYEELLDMAQTPVEYLSVTGDKAETTLIRTRLGSMKYTVDEMTRPISELSGGQKAKIFLLKISMSGADVLILDEPTRNFSPLSGPVIRQALSSYGGAIISISHDRKYISEVCNTVYGLTEKGLEKIR